MEAIPPYLTALIAVLLVTSFIKIFTSLNILRYGIGLNGGGFGVVILGVSLALTLLVMEPQIKSAGGLEAIFHAQSGPAIVEKTFRPFMEKHVNQEVKGRLEAMAIKIAAKSEGKTSAESKPPEGESSFPLLTASFVISEVKVAFQIGLMLLIPFVVIDLVITNVLTVLGITQMPHSVVALPLKLLLFFVVDGWTLVSEKLLAGYF